jgi:hypothetical protein
MKKAASKCSAAHSSYASIPNSFRLQTMTMKILDIDSDPLLNAVSRICEFE